MAFDPETIYGPCSICGAVQVGAWPHPLGEPCPQKKLIDDVYVEMVEEQRKSFARMRPPSFRDLFKL